MVSALYGQVYLHLTFHNNEFCHPPLEKHWTMLSVCYHHLGVSRWAEKILPCHQLMPYKCIQFRGVHMCDAPRNCDRISNPSIENESPREKAVPEKENASASPSAPIDKGLPFWCSGNVGFSQRKPLQPLLYSWSLTNVCALSWLHIFGAKIPDEGKSHSGMW